MTLNHLILTFIIGLSFIGCTPTIYVLHGRVVNGTGQEIADADVETEPFTNVTITNQRGYFTITQKVDNSVKLNKTESYTLLIRKNGFEDFKTSVQPQDSNDRPIPKYILQIRKGFEEVDSKEQRQLRQNKKTKVPADHPPIWGG